MNTFEQKNAELVNEPTVTSGSIRPAELIPTALVAMLVEGDEEFNR
jgi:hypothetical protein